MLLNKLIQKGNRIDRRNVSEIEENFEEIWPTEYLNFEESKSQSCALNSVTRESLSNNSLLAEVYLMIASSWKTSACRKLRFKARVWCVRLKFKVAMNLVLPGTEFVWSCFAAISKSSSQREAGCCLHKLSALKRCDVQIRLKESLNRLMQLLCQVP